MSASEGRGIASEPRSATAKGCSALSRPDAPRSPNALLRYLAEDFKRDLIYEWAARCSF